MRVLILGDIQRNSGPSNAHREFLKHWPDGDNVDYIMSQSKVGFLLEGVRKGLSCDVAISPCLDLACIAVQKIIHIFGKPVVSFNHGYVVFENEINEIGHSERWLNLYRNALRDADLIVTNSAHQASFLIGFQPELAAKTQSIMLGVDEFEQMQRSDNDSCSFTISVSGGSRPIKGNDAVVKACGILHDRGIDCSLQIYGRYSQDDDFIVSLPKSENYVMGHVDHDEFIKGLNKTDVFVMNSRHESFGLSAFDALQAGCSLLVSKNCGVLEALSPKDCDVIEDCEDVREIADKIAYLLGHPNALRLYETIDFSNISWNKQVLRLREACAVAAKDTLR